jgi:leucyl aminopeptidase
VVAAGSREEFELERARNVVAAGVRSLWQSTNSAPGRWLCQTSSWRPFGARGGRRRRHFALVATPIHTRQADDDTACPPLDEVVLIVTDDVDAQAGHRPRSGDWRRGQLDAHGRQRAGQPHDADAAGEGAQELAEGCRRGLRDPRRRCLPRDRHEHVPVGRRRSDEPAKLIVLRYHGRGGDGYDLGVVGKGITFDSGGISIKPADEMHLMRYDMSGAAAVIAATATIARLGLKVNVICVAPCTENLPGGHATKPGDVVTSLSGKTGRDHQHRRRGSPRADRRCHLRRARGRQRIVDVATLTGAIASRSASTTPGCSAGRAASSTPSARRGDAAGERLWPMPVVDEYRDNIKGEVADLRNSAGRMGSAITGRASSRPA